MSRCASSNQRSGVDSLRALHVVITGAGVLVRSPGAMPAAVSVVRSIAEPRGLR
jgi:hypothetical protein